MNIMLVIGPRADARDRHPQGDRRARPGHPGPVPRRGPGPLHPRRPHRHRLRAAVSFGIGQLAGWGFTFNPTTVVVAVSVQPRGRCRLRRLAGARRPLASIPSSPFATNDKESTVSEDPTTSARPSSRSARSERCRSPWPMPRRARRVGAPRRPGGPPSAAAGPAPRPSHRRRGALARPPARRRGRRRHRRRGVRGRAEHARRRPPRSTGTGPGNGNRVPGGSCPAVRTPAAPPAANGGFTATARPRRRRRDHRRHRRRRSRPTPSTITTASGDHQVTLRAATTTYHTQTPASASDVPASSPGRRPGSSPGGFGTAGGREWRWLSGKAARATAPAPDRVRRHRQSRDWGRLTAMHLLVIEDDPRLGRLLRRLLEEDRHVVELAHRRRVRPRDRDGDATASTPSSSTSGCPDISGLEVARRLRATGSRCRRS